MEDNNNRATEANDEGDVTSHYEFAFHILPTVALEEVPSVFGDIKTLIDHAGGSITSEEAPQKFDLAYKVVKHTEGKNLSFNHSYFGWVRFTLTPEKLAGLKTEIEHNGNVLRFLILKLTKAEMEHPFKMFEVKRKHKAEQKDEEGKVAEVKEVSEADIEKSLEDITA